MWKDDHAVSDALGSILLVGMTVASFVGLSALVLSIPAPPDTIHAEIDIKVKPGPDITWGTGDEYIQIRHLYGESVPLKDTRFLVSINNLTTEYKDAALGFSDDTFDLGERWTVTQFISYNDKVETHILVGRGAGSAFLATSSVITGKTECTADVNPPNGVFLQQPNNLEAALGNKPLEVTVILTDTCSTVDTGVDPALDYWFDSGLKSSIVMTYQGNNRWNATIPAPFPGGWLTKAFQDFHYQAKSLTDVVGNVGNSDVITDYVDPLPPAYHYVDAAIPGLGSITEFARMQNATDSGATAELREAPGSGGAVNYTLHANGFSTVTPFLDESDLWKNKENMLGMDFKKAVYQEAPHPSNARLRVEMDNAGVTSGQVLSVKAAVNAHIKRDNELIPGDDGYRLQLCWTGQPVTGTSCSAKSPTLPADPFENEIWMEYDFTNSRPGGGTWLPSELDNVDVIIEGVVVAGIRDGDYVVTMARLQAQVGAGYSMDHEFFWQNKSIAPTSNSLEMRYYSANGAFFVEVWDGAAYNKKGADLQSPGLTTWNTVLNSNEWNNGNVQIRINSKETSPAVQATLYIDYLRVTSA